MKNPRGKALILGSVLGLAFLAVCAFLVFDAFFLEPNWISVRRARIENPALARALKGLKVAQISDLHLGRELGARECSLIRRLRRIAPDIILVSGDIFEDPASLRAALSFFSALKPGLWSYGVLGNSDRAHPVSAGWRDALRRAGLSLIGGEALRMSLAADGSEFYLAGLDFPGYGVKFPPEELDRILQQVPGDKPVIFLAYSPEVAPDLAARGVDLVLSGDTHGGQIGLPGLENFFAGLNRPSYLRGLYRLGRTALYVNRGIATKGIPASFLCPPEITLFDFTD